MRFNYNKFKEASILNKFNQIKKKLQNIEFI